MLNAASGNPNNRSRWPTTLFGVILAVIGLVLAIGGIRLVALDGSWYYMIAGIAMVISGVFYIRRQVLGAWLYAAVFVATVIWSYYEIGTTFWGWVPRMAPMLVLGLIAALLVPRLKGRPSRMAYAAAAAQLIVLVAGAASMFVPHGVISNTAQLASAPAVVTDAGDAENSWKYFGKSVAGTRYAPYQQINRKNVHDLEVAWTFQTGEEAIEGSEDQNTPIQVGDTLYLCTPRNKVFALNAETGEQRWMFDPKVESNKMWNRCRGVAYYEPAPAAAAPANGTNEPAPANPAPAAACSARIITTTLKAQLLSLDAKTGEPCPTFGQNGVVDLSVGMGELKDWYYMPTSQPTVVGGLIVVGGWVWDGRETGEPSGVVRAFDADTGALAWAWDLGNPAITKLPPEGESYTRGTPNFWSTPAVDEKLGMIYLPLGNGTPDFWAGHRSEATNKYSTSVVALDLATGREVWHRQTAHLDTWDYDNGTPPALYDLPNESGGTTPALILATKTAQIFMLDRRTGEPIAKIEDKPVPQTVMEGDKVAKTQPFSVGMPSIGTDRLTEESMWGATFFDQLYCRVQFRETRYEGPFTKVTGERTLIYPGFYGGMNWGGVSVDEANGLLIVNDIRQAQVVWLVPQEDVEARRGELGAGFSVHLQKGTPYQAFKGPFNSFLGIPCQSPSWGTLTGIDLKTRQIVWQRPLGTVEDVVMHGMKVRLPVPLGMPTLSGAISTAGGLVFFSGTQDYYLRAFDIANGEEVWKGRLPVGAQATPMTYLSAASGRQFVVTTAGGARQSPDRGDYVVAYALPKGNAPAPLPKDTPEEKTGASGGDTPAERTEPASPEKRY